MLHQTFLFLGQLLQLFEVSQILEFLRYPLKRLCWSQSVPKWRGGGGWGGEGEGPSQCCENKKTQLYLSGYKTSFPSVEWLQITQSVLWKFAKIWVYLSQTIPKIQTCLVRRRQLTGMSWKEKKLKREDHSGPVSLPWDTGHGTILTFES